MVQEEQITLYGMNLEELRSWVYVDGTSPSGLRWKRYASSTAVKDQIAGCFSETVPHPCWRIKVNKTPMVLSRLLWFLVYEEVPDVVDHKDGNPKNNSISNLRNVSTRVNTENQIVLNPNGVPGVYRVTMSGREYWRCQGTNSKGARWNKTFSINRYGDDSARDRAIAYRLNSENENKTQTRRRTLGEVTADEGINCG